jgi:hypothetical protein
MPCHGSDQKGAGNYPALIDINKKYSEEQFNALLTGGRRMMPAFSQLSATEKKAIASFILKTRGHYVVYIGSSTPIDDLNQLFKVHQPDVLFCAITNANSNIPIQVYINTLARNWPNTTICLTGNQIVKRRDLKAPSNCRIIASPNEFYTYLDALQSGGKV